MVTIHGFYHIICYFTLGITLFSDATNSIFTTVKLENCLINPYIIRITKFTNSFNSSHVLPPYFFVVDECPTACHGF